MYKVYQIFVVVPVLVVMSAWAGTTMAVMCPLTAWLKQHFCHNTSTSHGGNGGLLRIFVRPDWWGTFASRYWAKAIMRASLIPVHVEGRENIEEGQSYVFMANHQGAYDIFLICGYLGKEVRWMLKRSLEKVPFLGIGCRHAGYIYVDNHNAGEVRATYRRAEAALKDGASVMVFPEGARTWDGRMRPFRRGAFMLADELQLPVLPMTINGSFHILPRMNDGKFIHRHPLSLTIHKPIYPIGQGQENIQHLMEESYRIINSAVEK